MSHQWGRVGVESVDVGPVGQIAPVRDTGRWQGAVKVERQTHRWQEAVEVGRQVGR